MQVPSSGSGWDLRLCVFNLPRGMLTLLVPGPLDPCSAGPPEKGGPKGFRGWRERRIEGKVSGGL